MATIIKREGKKGVSYKIQVAVKDVGLGKIVTKSITWKPQKGMSTKDTETACAVFADNFEKQVIQSFKTAEEDKGNINMTFTALSKKWLERSGKIYGEGYVGLAEQSLKVVLPMIGGYKVKDITASVVQSVFDRIDKLNKHIERFYPKKDIKEILSKNGITFIWLRNETELNCASIGRIFNGKHVGKKFATMFAEVCGMEIKKLFDVEMYDEQYSKTTLKRFKLAIYNVLAYAVRLCLIDKNYASSSFVDMGRIERKAVKCMEEDELNKFYSALCSVENIQWRVSVKTILMTGMRRGELCGLNWEDIDWDKGKIHIQRSYSECPHAGMKLKEPKTTTSKRAISIPELLLEELKEYKKWYDQQRELWGDRWVESGSVFIQRHGERIHPANIKMWVNKTCQKAKIPHYSVHSLRHTNITLQIMAGVPISTVSGRAGHSKTSTTTDIYAYYIQSSDISAAKTINDIFSREIG